MRDWVEVCIAVTPETEEAMANALFEMGSEGVVQTQDSTPDMAGLLTGYLPDDEGFEAKKQALQTLWDELCQLGLASHPLRLTVRPIPVSEWADAWRKWFTPIRVSDRITVTPSDMVVERTEDEIVIRINPGMAFGTGGHETTKLCLRALEREIKPGDRVLDVGTGSAILAIAATRLGAASATGIDIDPETIENACENIGLNGVEDRVEVYTGDIGHPEVRGPYRVIVSNIDVRTLSSAIDRMARLLTSDGVMILSGILIAESQLLIDALQQAGATVENQETLGEWWLCTVLASCRKTRDGR